MTGPAGDESAFLAAFGTRLRERRRALRLTQQQLAELGEVARTSVANIEAGRQTVNVWQLVQYCRALQVSADSLLGLTDDLQPPASFLEQVRAEATAHSVKVVRDALDAATRQLIVETFLDPDTFRREWNRRQAER